MDMTPVFGEKDCRLEYHSRESCYAVIFDLRYQQVATIISAKGSYLLPGGGIEEGETLQDCLIRELLEETGYKVKVGPYIGKAKRYFITSKNIPILNCGHFFLATFIERVSDPIDTDHVLKWINVDESQNLLFHEHQSWAVMKANSILSM